MIQICINQTLYVIQIYINHNAEKINWASLGFSLFLKMFQYSNESPSSPFTIICFLKKKKIL